MSKTDFPATKNWVDVWGTEDVAIGTTFGTLVNEKEVVIKAPESDGYNMMMKMSVMHQTKGSTTTLWWGYSS